MPSKMSVTNEKICFIGIGGQRCGKNTIYTWLEEHPQICTTPKMELHYFTHKYSRGYEWYESHFQPDSHTQIIGEMSSSYLYDYETPERVYKYKPDMKIILSVRDPVKRLVSAFKHDIQTGCIPSKAHYSIEEGIRNNPTYIEYGLYYTHLKRWLEIFPKENILVIDFHKMINHPVRFSTELFNFLGVDSSFIPSSVNRTYNKSYIPRHEFPLRFITFSRRILETLGLKQLVSVLKRAGVRNYIDALNDSKVLVELSDAETKTLEDVFRDSNKSLSALLNTDNLFK